jgi:hypothetical protein
MFKPVNIHYEASERQRALGFGGIGAIHTLAGRLGLPEILDDQLHLLKFHLPYHESDHVLNMAYPPRRLNNPARFPQPLARGWCHTLSSSEHQPEPARSHNKWLRAAPRDGTCFKTGNCEHLRF